jgi:ABC-2 type transport system permease protein
MGSLLAVVVISALFHVITPNNIGTVVLGFVLGMAAMMALGSLVSARVSRASTGTAIGNIIFFPVLLTAGVSQSSSRAPCSTRSRSSTATAGADSCLAEAAVSRATAACNGGTTLWLTAGPTGPRG